MKGIVFTELLSMAESTLGEDAMDEILDRLTLPNGGAYTAVGFYPCSELQSIVGAISDHTGHSSATLQHAFGGWMLGRFAELYPQFFLGKTCALEMLESIEGEVHVEVAKLYPDAELPRFTTDRPEPDHLRMRYQSARPLASFCHGLVEATVAHFGQRARIAVEEPALDHAIFDIRLER